MKTYTLCFEVEGANVKNFTVEVQAENEGAAYRQGIELEREYNGYENQEHYCFRKVA